jgi:hypothetical protein
MNSWMAVVINGGAAAAADDQRMFDGMLQAWVSQTLLTA